MYSFLRDYNVMTMRCMIGMCVLGFKSRGNIMGISKIVALLRSI